MFLGFLTVSQFLYKRVGVLIVTLLLLGSSIWATTAQTMYTNARLLSDYESVQPGQTIQLAVELKHKENWHSYWKNPGDSGFPTMILWTSDTSLSFSDIQWPAPNRYAVGKLQNFGYNHSVLITKATLPKQIDQSFITLTANVSLLVCEQSCIPEKFSLSKRFKVLDIAIKSPDDAVVEASKLTQPSSEFNVELSENDTEIVIEFYANDALLNAIDKKVLYLFPEQSNVFLREPSLNYSIKDNHFRITLAKESSEKISDFSAVLRINNELAVLLRATISEPLSIGTVILWCLAAFIGGLILNIMPCVLPILSLKVFGIVTKSKNEQVLIRKQALAYTLGIIFSFILIVACLLLVKLLGYKVGWGFQLQNPLVVFLLAIGLYVIGLHFNGMISMPDFIYKIPAVFSVRTASVDKGIVGDFFTGMLAVFVATPCTAPFMAGAIAVALTQSALIMIVIFLSLAFGFAVPYLAIAFIPALQKFLPKPGNWMDKAKHVLAIPMYATVLWLIWVLDRQIQLNGTLLMGAFCLVILAVLFAKKRVSQSVFKTLLGFLLGVFVLLGCFVAFSPTTTALSTHTVSDIEEAVQQHKKVFVDVTAAWCITCKVNEETVLNTEEIQQLFAKEGVQKIVLDWTNYDEEITGFLEKHGRVGVPLYIYYNESGDATILPQVLTKDIVKRLVKS